METNEVWKDIQGYESHYQVSDMGNVKSIKFQKKIFLKKSKDKDGYLRVTLCYKGAKKGVQVHRLVCESFMPNIDLKPEVNHKNGVKTDNFIDNLEHCTHSENIQHSFDNLNRTKARAWLGKFGKDNPNSKLVIMCDRFTGKILREFAGCCEAQRETGVLQSSISNCCNGHKNYSHAGGYKWKYKETTI